MALGVARDGDRWLHERMLWARGRGVAGLDEVGTGAWAGPVVAGCVVFPPDVFPSEEGDDGQPARDAIDDSKRLTPARRAELDVWIRENARAVGLGWVEGAELPALGLYRASLLAMERALADAMQGGPTIQIDHLLVDARTLPSFRGDQTALVGGDRLSASIGAASIVAKVARDRFMVAAAKDHPRYGFERHKGYGTAAHREAIATYGPCPLHRPAFLPQPSAQLALLE
jgi:ribonuclease HII